MLEILHNACDTVLKKYCNNVIQIRLRSVIMRAAERLEYCNTVDTVECLKYCRMLVSMLVTTVEC